MAKSFYSNGKLLLAGEYAVLDGAQAWAIPTKFGQSLKVTKNATPLLSWKSYDEKRNIWFESLYKITPLSKVSSSDAEMAGTLMNILQQAQKLNPYFLVDTDGYEVETKLDFPKNWGLGTSSTLINNIANWANIDPYTLLQVTFGGSGYDIACAKHDQPILFHTSKGIPVVMEVKKEIPFADALYFIHLNQKKNSREAITHYGNLNIDRNAFVDKISDICKRMIASQTLKDFERLISSHEKEISGTLGLKTVKSSLFSDYWGAIKSLGAWGGDFVLATGNEETPDYFQKKGYPTVIPFNDMIL